MSAAKQTMSMFTANVAISEGERTLRRLTGAGSSDLRTTAPFRTCSEMWRSHQR
jgi:hypothetical protein